MLYSCMHATPPGARTPDPQSTDAHTHGARRALPVLQRTPGLSCRRTHAIILCVAVRPLQRKPLQVGFENCGQLLYSTIYS